MSGQEAFRGYFGDVAFSEEVNWAEPDTVAGASTTLTGAHAIGVTTLTVASTTGFLANEYIRLGDDETEYEVHKIKTVTDSTTLELYYPLATAYIGGEAADEIGFVADKSPGLVQSIEPDVTTEYLDLRAIGASDRLVYEHIPIKIETSISLNWFVQHGFMMLYALGKINSTGTVDGAGGTSTLDANYVRGNKVITVVAGTNFLANDYCRIGDSASTYEIHQISTVVTNTITLKTPLRADHASGVAVIEMDNALPYTHTIAVGNVIRSFTLAAALEEATNFVRTYPGCTIESLELSCAVGEPLRARASLCSKTPITSTTMPTVTHDTIDPFLYFEGTITYDIGAGAVELPEVQSVTLSIDNGIKKQRFIDASGGKDIHNVFTGNNESSGTIEIVPDDNTFYAWIASEQKIDEIVIQFDRGTNDYVKITLTDVHVTNAPISVPVSDDIITESLALKIEDISIEIKNSTGDFWA